MPERTGRGRNLRATGRGEGGRWSVRLIRATLPSDCQRWPEGKLTPAARRPPTTRRPGADRADRAGGGGEKRRSTGRGTCDGSRTGPGREWGEKNGVVAGTEGSDTQPPLSGPQHAADMPGVHAARSCRSRSWADRTRRDRSDSGNGDCRGHGPPVRRDACWRGPPQGTSIVAASAPGDNPKAFGLLGTFIPLPCPTLVRCEPPVTDPAPQNCW